MERRHRALLSYTRADDTTDAQFFTQLRERLSNEVRGHIGREFPVFQDTEEIRWGQYFHERIEGSFQSVTFFIPVLTPDYFKSTYCREELRRFLRYEEQFRRYDLVLPIYYIPCEALENRFRKIDDDLALMVAERSVIDWRNLRSQSFDTPTVQAALQEVASRIRDVVYPVSQPSLVSEGQDQSESETDSNRTAPQAPSSSALPESLSSPGDASSTHVGPQSFAGGQNGQRPHDHPYAEGSHHPPERPARAEPPSSPARSSAPSFADTLLASREPGFHAELQGMVEQKVGAVVHSIAFSPDMSLLASGGRDNKVRLWSVLSGREIQRMEGHSSYVVSVAFSPDRQYVASGSRDRSVRLWDVESGEEVQRMAEHSGRVTNIAFSPDGRLVASSSEDKTVRIWDLARGRIIRRIEGHTRPVVGVSFSTDGTLLVSGSEDDTVRVWEVATGKEVQRFQGHTDHVRTVAFSPDGLLVASGGDDQIVRIWDIASGRTVHRFRRHQGGVECVAFSANGHLLASGSSDHTVRVFQRAHELEVQDFDDYHDRIARLWEIASEVEVIKLPGERDYVRSIAFSPDSRMMAIVTDNQTLRLCGLALPDHEWRRIEQAWADLEEQKREERWSAGQCEDCGASLGMFERMSRQRKCKKCRQSVFLS